uniref:PH domain-containing protein n=1 Tax=Macrostomum lignano TaxID=282301 RepID=A0A1I8FP85_9PLAT
MAFETIVKQQIARMKEPTLKCVDMVVEELINVVHHCTEKMSSYPRLREATESIVTNRIREQEGKTKSQLMLLVDIQLAYMNTNHEDFIGFANAQQTSDSSRKERLGNQVIRKGYLTLNNVSIMRGGSKECWFVLTAESLSWFKDEEEREKKYMLPLDGLKIRDGESRLFGKKNIFVLFHSEGRNTYKDYKYIELAAETADEVDSWKASLLRAGVYSQKESEERRRWLETEVSSSTDPQNGAPGGDHRNLVESYMKIVDKDSARRGAQDRHSPDCQRVRREETLRIYKATKEALQILSDVSASTTHTPTPPPVKDDWIQPDSHKRPGGAHHPPPSPAGGEPRCLRRPRSAAAGANAAEAVDAVSTGAGTAAARGGGRMMGAPPGGPPPHQQAGGAALPPPMVPQQQQDGSTKRHFCIRISNTQDTIGIHIVMTPLASRR